MARAIRNHTQLTQNMCDDYFLIDNGDGVPRPDPPRREPISAISNRNDLQLRELVTSTKQRPVYMSNRNKIDPSRRTFPINLRAAVGMTTKTEATAKERRGC